MLPFENFFQQEEHFFLEMNGRLLCAISGRICTDNRRNGFSCKLLQIIILNLRLSFEINFLCARLPRFPHLTLVTVAPGSTHPRLVPAPSKNLTLTLPGFRLF
jgi:hypothetical protein